MSYVIMHIKKDIPNKWLPGEKGIRQVKMKRLPGRYNVR